MKPWTWEEIHGFSSFGEYERFVRYLEAQVAQAAIRELPVDPAYGAGQIYGGRWFMDMDSQKIWRLISPDIPFKGLWEPVEIDQRVSLNQGFSN